jgi:hypothetical protein
MKTNKKMIEIVAKVGTILGIIGIAIFTFLIIFD